jgi:hypothetical protein
VGGDVEESENGKHHGGDTLPPKRPERNGAVAGMRAEGRGVSAECRGPRAEGRKEQPDHSGPSPES